MRPIGQRRETREHLVGLQDGESVGLVPVAAQLGQELVGRDAHRGRDPGLGADAPLDEGRDGGRRAEQARAAGHVEEGLVDGERLDQRRDALADREDALAHLGIALEAALDDGGLRAQPLGTGHGHRGTASEAPRLVARRRDDAARAVVPDEHRTAAQLGPVELLDRRVEGVHVHVQDGAEHRGHIVAGRTARGRLPGTASGVHAPSA
jgi:hypothetical protein